MRSRGALEPEREWRRVRRPNLGSCPAAAAAAARGEKEAGGREAGRRRRVKRRRQLSPRPRVSSTGSRAHGYFTRSQLFTRRSQLYTPLHAWVLRAGGQIEPGPQRRGDGERGKHRGAGKLRFFIRKAHEFRHLCADAAVR
jgi:hypothetical protein